MAITPTPADEDTILLYTLRTHTKTVKIHFRPVGGAAIMRKNKFVIGGKEEFASIDIFLRRQLRMDPSDPLFLYCNSAFAPSPDQQLASLFVCFQVAGELIVNYSTTGAWG
jgi:ubiquitin-like protein ATG12